jgi:hypothetical protein
MGQIIYTGRKGYVKKFGANDYTVYTCSGEYESSFYDEDEAIAYCKTM